MFRFSQFHPCFEEAFFLFEGNGQGWVPAFQVGSVYTGLSHAANSLPWESQQGWPLSLCAQDLRASQDLSVLMLSQSLANGASWLPESQPAIIDPINTDSPKIRVSCEKCMISKSDCQAYPMLYCTKSFPLHGPLAHTAGVFAVPRK